MRYTEDDLDDIFRRLERLEDAVLSSPRTLSPAPESAAEDEFRRVLLPLLTDALRRPAPAPAPTPALTAPGEKKD